MLDIEDFKKKLDKKSRLMGIDPGKKRVGIAISDENKIIATPYTTIIKNNFSVEGVKVHNLVKKFNTTIYCYSHKRLRENIKNFINNFRSFSPLICFAVKANPNINLIKDISKL